MDREWTATGPESPLPSCRAGGGSRRQRAEPAAVSSERPLRLQRQHGSVRRGEGTEDGLIALTGNRCPIAVDMHALCI